MHADSACDRLNFYRCSWSSDKKTAYAVVNSSGQYMGVVSLDGDYSAIKDAVTNNKTVNYNSNNGAVTLDCFFLEWNSTDKCYEFCIMGATNNASAENVNKQIPVISYQYTKLNYNDGYWHTSCTHTYNSPAEYKTKKIYVCGGHLDLQVDMVVTSMQDSNKDALFEAARKVPKCDPHTTYWPLTIDPELGIFGVGGMKFNGFDPSVDWADASLKSMANTKAENVESYTIPADKSASELAITIRHYNGSPYKNKKTTFSSLASGAADNIVLFGMKIGGKVFYVESFVSGEQKDIVYFLYDNTIEDYREGTIDIKISSSGKVSIDNNT
jgi:hypothetical protein